ncbi:hypothetical protein GC163_03415 [bacterium]|nr:hypothetical protein [bacterium]
MTSELEIPSESDNEPHWTGEELEAAYLRALDALEAVESDVVATAEELAPGRFQDEPSDVVVEPESPAEALSVDAQQGAQVSAEQVVEACLFVGGPPLTAAKLTTVLRGSYTAEDVVTLIDRINQRYTAQLRPYEIRLGDGGYRLALLDEHERIRHKVYGLGPKEVRLSQDALEVLALVAYHQPVNEAQLDGLGRPQCGATLRLLLRRDLIAVERSEAHPKDVKYVTTERFLSLFGLGSLRDLPRPDDLLFK